jgi:hypothetical protein
MNASLDNWLGVVLPRSLSQSADYLALLDILEPDEPGTRRYVAGLMTRRMSMLGVPGAIPRGESVNDARQ